jgi:glutamyl-tRNA synthetase
MSRDELVERFSLERVGSNPATFDYAKLDWMNGVYLRDLPPEEYATRLVGYLRERGLEWPEESVRAAAPIVQEKMGRLEEFPGFAGFLFHEVEPDPSLLDGRILEAAQATLGSVDSWTAAEIEVALKRLCEELGEKPRTVYVPIRVAVTGSRVSPGLYESLELLGKDTALRRIRAAAAA